ncbi:MAG: hypothetical protein IT538_04820 [Variibacter sp.]|nr:hypothetical protein [Variibacter sp.]
MNKIVREHYPVSKLPDDLREGLSPSAAVTITLVQEDPPKSVLSIDEMFALRAPPYRSKEEINAFVREMRDDWDDRG